MEGSPSVVDHGGADSGRVSSSRPDHDLGPIRGGGEAAQRYKSGVDAVRETGMNIQRDPHADHASGASPQLLIFSYT